MHACMYLWYACMCMYICMHVWQHKKRGKPAPPHRTQATGTRSGSACRREGRCRASWEPVSNRGVSYHVKTGLCHTARAQLLRNLCHIRAHFHVLFFFTSTCTCITWRYICRRCYGRAPPLPRGECVCPAHTQAKEDSPVSCVTVSYVSLRDSGICDCLICVSR